MLLILFPCGLSKLRKFVIDTETQSSVVGMVPSYSQIDGKDPIMIHAFGYFELSTLVMFVMLMMMLL